MSNESNPAKLANTVASPAASPMASAMNHPGHRLRHLPISFFAIVMGLAGLAIALQRAGEILGLSPLPGVAAAWLAGLVFAILFVLYGTKLLRHPGDVAKELKHPIKLSFFPTISIGLILLGIAFHDLNANLAAGVLIVGVPLQLGFTLFVLSRWISHSHFEIHHSNPSWFIPVVGNILVPIAILPHGLVELSWFFFSIGLVFWLVLLAIFFNRIIFHPPLPEKLAPTLFILIAPPAVGFIAWVKLSGGLDGSGRILYYTAAFTVLLLLALFQKFRGLRFFLSWWAYSFPSAAFTIASLLMFKLTAMAFFEMLSWVMLGALVLLIAGLTLRTLTAIRRGEICVED